MIRVAHGDASLYVSLMPGFLLTPNFIIWGYAAVVWCWSKSGFPESEEEDMEEPLEGFHDSWHHTSKTTQENATISALSFSPGLPTLGPLSRSAVTSDVIFFKTPPLITQLEQLVFPPVF